MQVSVEKAFVLRRFDDNKCSRNHVCIAWKSYRISMVQDLPLKTFVTCQRCRVALKKALELIRFHSKECFRNNV